MIFLQALPPETPFLNYLAYLLLIGIVVFRLSLILRSPKKKKAKKKTGGKKKKWNSISPYEQYLKKNNLLGLKSNRFNSALYSAIFPSGSLRAIITVIILVFLLIIAADKSSNIFVTILGLILIGLLLRAVTIFYKYRTDKEFKLIISGIYNEPINAEKSLGFFKAAAEMNPRLYTCDKVSGKIHYQASLANKDEEHLIDYEKANQWLTKGIDHSNIIVPKIQIQRASYRVKDFQFEEAQEDYDLIRKVCGKSWSKELMLDWHEGVLYLNWGKYLAATGNLEEALEKFDKSIPLFLELFSNQKKEMYGVQNYLPEALYLKGDLFLLQEEFELAKEGFSKSLKSLFQSYDVLYWFHSEHHQSQVLLNVERAFKASNDYQGLIALYKSLIEADENHKYRVFHKRLITLLKNTGNKKEVLSFNEAYEKKFSEKAIQLECAEEYIEYLDLTPSDLPNEMLTDLPFVQELVRIGELVQAEAIINNHMPVLSKENPQEAIIWLKVLVGVKIRKWEFNSAIEICDEVIENTDSTHSWLYIKNIEILMDLGSFAEAAEMTNTFLDKIGKENMEEGEGLVLVEAYERKCQFSDALELCEELKLDKYYANPRLDIQALKWKSHVERSFAT